MTPIKWHGVGRNPIPETGIALARMFPRSRTPVGRRVIRQRDAQLRLRRSLRADAQADMLAILVLA